jgi:HSP20 family protein
MDETRVTFVHFPDGTSQIKKTAPVGGDFVMANGLVRNLMGGSGSARSSDESFWREIDRAIVGLKRNFVGQDDDKPARHGFARSVLAPEDVIPDIPLEFDEEEEEIVVVSQSAQPAAKAEVLPPPPAAEPTPIRLKGVAPQNNGSLNPICDAYEDDDNFEIIIELAGVKPDDIDIEFADGGLNITAERKRAAETNGQKKHVIRERTFGTFKRRFQIPFQANPDIIEAEFEDGVVLVTVPRPPETKPRVKKIGLKHG